MGHVLRVPLRGPCHCCSSPKPLPESEIWAAAPGAPDIWSQQQFAQLLGLPGAGSGASAERQKHPEAASPIQDQLFPSLENLRGPLGARTPNAGLSRLGTSLTPVRPSTRRGPGRRAKRRARGSAGSHGPGWGRRQPEPALGRERGAVLGAGAGDVFDDVIASQ